MSTLPQSTKPAYFPSLSQKIVEWAERLSFFQYRLLALVPACAIAFSIVSGFQNPLWTILFSSLYYLAVGLMFFLKILDWSQVFQLDSTGVRISSLWGKQYIPFSEIDELRQNVCFDGKMRLGIVDKRDPARCTRINLLSDNHKRSASEIQEQFDRYCGLSQSVPSVPDELLRKNRLLPLWLMALDCIAVQATDLSPYRRQTVDSEKLLQLLENSGVTEEVRAAAAYVLARSDAGRGGDIAIQHSSPLVVCLGYLGCPSAGPVSNQRFQENLSYLSRRDRRSIRAILASNTAVLASTPQKARVEQDALHLRVAASEESVESLLEQEPEVRKKRVG